MPTKDEYKKEIKKEIDVIPAQGATDADYDKYVASMIGKVKDVSAGQDSELMEAMGEFLEESYGGNETPSKETQEKLMGISRAFARKSMEYKVELNKKIDVNLEKVKNGDYPGTEYLTEDEGSVAKRLATNITILQNKGLYDDFRKFGELYGVFLNQATTHYKQVEKEIDDPEHEGQKKKIVEEITLAKLYEEDGKKVVDDLFENKYKDLADKKNEYNSFGANNDTVIRDDHGYKMNMEYKSGEPFFTKLPDEIEAINKAENGQQLEGLRDSYCKQIDACDKYIENTKVMAKNARAMLKELKAIKRNDGKGDSEEYTKMVEALEAVGNLDQPYLDPRIDPNNPIKPIYKPDKINSALDTLKETAEAYQKKNDSIYKKHDFGRDRVNMSQRLQNFVTIAQPIMDASKYGLDKVKPVVGQRADIEKKLPRIELARKKKGFEEFGAYVRKEPTPLEKIENALKGVAAATEGVKGGSGAFSDAEKELKKARDYFKKHGESEFKSLDEERKSLERIQKHLTKANEHIDKYMLRKQEKGQLQAGATTDLKSQIRINALKAARNAARSLGSAVGDMMIENDRKAIEAVNEKEKKYLESEKLYNNFEVEQSILNLNNTNEPIRQIAAEGELTARKQLQTLIDENKKMTPNVMESVRKCVSAIVYNDTMKRLEQLPANISKNQQEYLQNIDKMANSPAVVKATEHMSYETINEFLADPKPIINKVTENRKAIREIQNRANNVHRNEIGNDQPVAGAAMNNN